MRKKVCSRKLRPTSKSHPSLESIEMSYVGLKLFIPFPVFEDILSPDPSLIRRTDVIPREERGLVYIFVFATENVDSIPPRPTVVPLGRRARFVALTFEGINDSSEVSYQNIRI